MLRNLRKYLLLLAGLAALAYFFYRFRGAIALEGFHWATVAESLRHARLSLLLLSIAAIYVCFALRALRWIRFCRWLGPAHFANVYSATLMGFACTFLLGRAAEPVRPVLIARKDSLSMPGMFGVYVLERVFDMAATALLAGFALLLFKHEGLSGGPLMRVARSAGMLLLAGMVGAIVFLVYFRHHGAGWLSRKLRESAWRHGWRGKVVLLMEGFIEGLQGIRTWSDLGVLSFYTAVHWLLVALVYLWVAHAFPGRLAGLSFGGATSGPGVDGGRLGAPTSGRRRGRAGGHVSCAHAHLWSRKGAGCNGIDRALAGDVCVMLAGRAAPAVPRRMVHGGTAAHGGTGRAGRRGRAAGGSRTLRGAAGAVEREVVVKCPFCAHVDDKVIDSREARVGDLIRRRRECLKCHRRFTTYERIDEIPYMVIKKDGRRERFDRQKILQGLLKACEKRPVPVNKLEAIVDEAESFVSEAPERERTTPEIGSLLMSRLKKLDKVAYVRFASVYLDFKDVKEFMDELKGLLKDRAKK